jgi:hypothetical protein
VVGEGCWWLAMSGVGCERARLDTEPQDGGLVQRGEVDEVDGVAEERRDDTPN